MDDRKLDGVEFHTMNIRINIYQEVRQNEMVFEQRLDLLFPRIRLKNTPS